MYIYTLKRNVSNMAIAVFFQHSIGLTKRFLLEHFIQGDVAFKQIFK